MSRPILGGVFAATLLACTAMSAVAADLPTAKATPTFVAAAQSPWMIRVRALGVLPDASAKFNVNGVPLNGASVNITDTLVPELDITYFFPPNIAVELILGTTPHGVRGTGVLANQPIGRVWLLPPTLTLQYHFTNFGPFKPYVGAGVNYTVFYGEKSRGIFTNFDVKNQFGFALQAGIDYMFDQHWGVNLDVKKLWLEPNAKATIPSAGNALVTGKVKIDPWLVGVGITYRF
jgi:outer membrane protein